MAKTAHPWLALLLLGLTSCTVDEADDPAVPDQYVFGGDRPAELLVPAAYDHATPTPLVFVLHGYSANGYVQLAYTGLRDVIDDTGVLMIAPDGTVDQNGAQFWNATDTCCDSYDTGIDDAGYLSGLIDEIRGVYNVDPQRIYFFGHSNGGYMSYRMACERADAIAAIASLAGATYLDPAACQPSEPVSVIQLHGTEDTSVPYATEDCGASGCRAPVAAENLDLWAAYDGCAADRQTLPERLELDAAVDGAETRVDRQMGCPDAVALELWSIEGGSHVPLLPDDFDAILWAWFAAHPKR
jgi:polyhydroxybutyrate depolymerase